MYFKKINYLFILFIFISFEINKIYGFLNICSITKRCDKDQTCCYDPVQGGDQ
jgi:hypothetical protein